MAKFITLRNGEVLDIDVFNEPYSTPGQEEKEREVAAKIIKDTRMRDTRTQEEKWKELAALNIQHAAFFTKDRPAPNPKYLLLCEKYKKGQSSSVTQM